MNNQNVNSKDIKSTNDNIDVFALLINLGLNPCLKGTWFLKDIILMCAKNETFKELSFKEIAIRYSDIIKIPPKKIISNIQYACHNINQIHAENNFKKYLNIDLDEYFLSKKQFLLILNNKIKKSSI